MKKYKSIIRIHRNVCICILLFGIHSAKAQNIEYSKAIIKELCSETYHGRGYVNHGVNQAANYLQWQFEHLKLKKFGNSYKQDYSFSVNTQPTSILCSVDKVAMRVGYEFLISAGSPSIHGTYNLLHYNSKDSLETILLLKKIKQGFSTNCALVLHQGTERNSSALIDSCKLYKHVPALIIYTESKKLTHTIRTEVDEIPSLVFLDSIIQNKELISVDAKNEFIKEYHCDNLISFIKGKQTDSFIVFSAHYDHLGMQGNAQFSGASDNASGTSMILYLADYYSKHKPKYTTIFILFSGEEAGLVGSNYFTEHPTFPLEKIKMLTNIDIMGNAEKGIVVVNGEVYKKQFDLLSSINDDQKLVPEVRIRGKAHNSDHYYFSEKGIPSIFIYSNGGQGFYHDIFDVADSINLTNYEHVGKLLIEFARQL